MKKLIMLILILAASSLLSACGGGGAESGSSNPGSNPTSSSGALLSWAAPSSRTDSSYLALSELDGYRIYYGTSAANLSVLVDLNDNSITEYRVSTLPAGNYYFAVTAYDMDGTESGFSNILNKDV